MSAVQNELAPAEVVVTIIPSTDATSTPDAPASPGAAPAVVAPTAPAPAAAAPVAAPAPSVTPTDEKTPIQFLSVDDLAKRFQVTLDASDPRHSTGLDATDAATRLARDGPNILTPPKELPEIVKFFMHFLDPFMLLLIFAATLSFIAYGAEPSIHRYKWVGIVLYIVVFTSSTFSYVQSGKASAAMKGFKNMLPKQCHVIRNGRLVDMPASELAVGDVVRISTGDQCPADMRLIYCNDLKVEASSLTGESVPVSCTTTSTETRPEEAKNMVWNSCQCMEGEAIGVVFATGDRTLIGRIARMATTSTHSASTLQREVNMFVFRLAASAMTLGVIFTIVGVGRGESGLDSFVNGFVVVLIACIPEGLPVTVATILGITGKRLADRHVFVKDLVSVETLGCATVIASDKTGTLTQNKMSVSRLWFDLTPFTVNTVYRDLGPSTLTMNAQSAGQFGGSATTLRALERVCAVCSRTRYEDQRELSDDEARLLDQQRALLAIDPNMTMRTAKSTYPFMGALFDNSMTINTAKRMANGVAAAKLNDAASAANVANVANVANASDAADPSNPANVARANDDANRVVIGDASETALFNFIRARHSIELVRHHNRMVFEVPFNSRNKYALTIMKPYNIAGNRDHRRMLLMKGAPEIILTRCNRYMLRGKELPIDDEFRAEFQKAYETFGGFGERVLGFAHEVLDEKQFPPEMDTKYNQKEENYPTRNLVFLGLVSLIDPPKETVPASIAMCRTAGVRVVMVTGDHPLTAAAIARQVGIITTPTRDELAKVHQIEAHEVPEDDVQAIVVPGTQLDSFSQQDWDRVLSKPEIVFARTTPAQKLQIVENLQRLKHVVAVTGDGVNDSPALKQADIGCAMGISGSDVARDAADIVLMNDDFSSIVVGIQEGRTIFDNLIKTIGYTVTHMTPEVLPILIHVAFGVPLAMNPILILCIDLATELAPAVSLAYEKAEDNVMQRPPRNVAVDHLVTMRTVLYSYGIAGVAELLTSYLAFFLVFNWHGIGVQYLSWVDAYFISTNDDSDGKWFCPGGFPDDGVCTTAYGADVPAVGYSPLEQNAILLQAQTAFWVTLTGSQVMHVFMCKTRQLSIFQHGWFENMVMNFGVIIEMCLIVIISLSPAHEFFQTALFVGHVWPVLLVGWVALITINEPRKWLTRKYPQNKFIQFLSW